MTSALRPVSSNIASTSFFRTPRERPSFRICHVVQAIPEVLGAHDRFFTKPDLLQHFRSQVIVLEIFESTLNEVTQLFGFASISHRHEIVEAALREKDGLK
ncbi:hypothetical protein A9K71_23615 [Mesorhizobium sp. WSM3873]|nr:hypothetical protein A9K71_23615 [Mesorhizobium sp. WSM3873]